MVLIVGLGNPGKKFDKTRHNLGARVIGGLERLNLKNMVLAKPTTFMPGSRNSTKLCLSSLPSAVVEFSLLGMNDSGKAILKLTKNYKLKTKNLFVVHDDLDLPLGKIKIVKNRGSGGHKGVESIIRELKTKNFVRFRLGIRPKPYTLYPTPSDKFVLGKFTKEEEKIVEKVVKKAAKAINFALKEGLEKAMSEYNK